MAEMTQTVGSDV